MTARLASLARRILSGPPAREDGRSPVRSRGRVVAVALAALLVAGVWVAHLALIPQGGISHYDEFHSLDRSAGFARHDDWLTVYSKNAPGFRKPPLQYWMTGALLEAGADPAVALRLPSMLFALGTLAATGWLAALLLPSAPWAIPAAVLLCASSLQFWRLATSAMLDAGAAFFATLALIAALLALRRPLWWYGMAVAVGLGALQKAPIGLVLVLLLLWALDRTRGRHDLGYARLRESPHFLRGLRLAILAALAWPVFQTVLHGGEVLEDLYGGQMIERFVPAGPLKDPRSAGDLWHLIVTGEPFWRVPAILALLWLPWRLRRPELLALAALFAIYVLAMGLAAGSVYARYTLVFVPLLAAALAVVGLTLFRPPWLGWALVLAVAAASGGPIKRAGALRLEQDPQRVAQIAVLSELGRGLAPAETLVTCNWNRETRFPPGAVSHYAAVNGRPFLGLDSAGQIEGLIEAGALTGPLRGLCTGAELDRIAGRLVDLKRGPMRDGYVFWTAAAAH